MAQWRIRVVVPDGPGGEQAVTSALAQVRASELRLAPHGPDPEHVAGDVVVELGEDGSLGDLLRTLHEISPQVFISRVSAPGSGKAAGGPIRVRPLPRIAGAAG